MDGRETALILITGPLYAGKKDVACKLLGISQTELADRAVCDAQELAADTDDIIALADALSERELVLITETGAGVVPVDAEERRAREAAGRLACLLAERAETVIRVFCGLHQVLKGELKK